MQMKDVLRATGQFIFFMAWFGVAMWVIGYVPMDPASITPMP